MIFEGSITRAIREIIVDFEKIIVKDHNIFKSVFLSMVFKKPQSYNERLI